jgi:hypothetical protein
MFYLSVLAAPSLAVLHAAAPSTEVLRTAAPASGCTGLEALNPLCYAATAVGSIGGSVASAGIDAILGGLSQWVAGGAEWLLSQIGNVLISTTTINVGAGWFRAHYGVMTALAGVVVLPLLLVSTMQAIVRQSASQLARTFFVQLPLALLLGVVAIQIVILCLSVTDAMCTAVAGGSGSDVKALLAGMTTGLLRAGGDPTVATFVVLLVGLLVAAAAFVLWLELLVRAAAVYVAVLFLPLALATLVWPSVSHWCRRLVETLAALILSKFVIVATLSLAAGAVTSGTSGTGSAGSGFSSVLAGGALLVLATFVPFSILRLIPAVEAGAVGHLEGARQRGTAVLTTAPRSAAQFAVSRGMAAHGAAKLAAMSGPPGTGRSEGLVGSEPGTAADCNDANGGLVPNADGMMIGLPVDEEALAARWWGEPRPRGPKPIRQRPVPAGKTDPAGEEAPPGAASGDAASGDLAPGLKLIGKPGPYDRRYAIGRDHVGPVIHGLDPLRVRGDEPPKDPESS